VDATAALEQAVALRRVLEDLGEKLRRARHRTPLVGVCVDPLA
jgi:hypothetical protein